MKKINIINIGIFILLLSCNFSFGQDGPTVSYDVEEGTWDADNVWYHNVIETKNAWEITKGSSDIVIVYLCRNGINWEHEKLRTSYDNINRTDGGEESWNTWNSFIGDGSDNDGNGVVDDWRGIKRLILPQTYVNNTLYTIYDPDHIDGTWLAGIISGINEDVTFTEDFYSVAGGVNQRGITLVPFSYDGLPENGSPEWLWNKALDYAIGIGAEIFLYDFSTQLTSTMELKLQEAHEAGIFIVAPSGWDGALINQVYDPAGFTFPYSNIAPTLESVFSVGGSTKPDAFGEEFRHPLAHYGQYPIEDGDFLDLVAPAEKIYTTSTSLSGANDDYKWVQGNAASAAMVAATAGLMLSVNPELETYEIRDILRETAEKINNQENGGDYNYYWNWNYPGYSQQCGYGRLNTYAAVCAALETAPPVEVVDGATWDEPVFSLNDIVVTADYNLTITSTVYFGNEASLIIEPGATVTIDGGTLTNYKFCGNEDLLWQGVEVWGNPSQNQYSTSGSCSQGKIILRNGAVIENAEIGVLLAARNDNSEGDFVNGGGIIEISNNGNPDIQTAVFRNNKKSVYFYSYHNYLPNDPNKKEVANLSKFENCKFTVNADYLEGGWYSTHVYLLDVYGVHFRGCTFENATPLETTGHGINAYQAGFTVEAICNSSQSPCPDEYLDRNTFTNFYKGINLVNGGTYTLAAEHADFSGNTTGISLSNVNNATVLSSNFSIGANVADAGQCEGEGKLAASYGIDMEACTGFAIEENSFEPGGTNGTYTGIRCKDSHTQYDIIYNNTFDGLSYGNFAEGMNRDIVNDAHGLEYLCNNNSENEVDFQVIESDDFDGMIRGYMGYVNDYSAGNTFSQQAGVDWHFLNLGTQQIDYWWYSGNAMEEPEYYCIFGSNPYPDPCYFTPYSQAIENTCPSHYGGGGGSGGEVRSLSLTPGQLQETELDYMTALNGYNNVKSLYDNLEDGGNTPILKSEVENAFPSDMWQIRTELLGISPHVSREVLMATAEKTEVFPESVLFEILSANPDELKNGDMISFLETKEDPLPAYMIDMLEQIAGGVTYKTVL